jgi:opacity protein-like surface antigen
MNRKGLVVLVVLAVLAAGNAFAQMPAFKLSAGAGGYFTSDFGGGYTYKESSIYNNELKIPYAGGGGFAFFDATFAELSFGFFAAGGEAAEVRKYPNGAINSATYRDFSYTGLDISLLGKYPFTLTEQFTLFPLLGIDYRQILSIKNKASGTKRNDSGDWSALWFKLGVGADYAFTDHIFARLGVLYGLRLANKWEKDGVNRLNPTYTDEKTRLGHGLDVKLAVGYRF